MNKQILGLLLLLTPTLFGAQQPTLTIIASVQNSDDVIEDFLFNITRQTMFNDCELLLYAHDTEGFEQAAITRYIKYYPQITYIAARTDIDLWHVRTIARAPYIVFLKVEKTFGPTYLEKLLASKNNEQEIRSVEYGAVLKNDKAPLFHSRNSI